MNKAQLEDALFSFKTELEEAIRTKKFGRKHYENGQKAKEAMIRSQKLIMKIHELCKSSLCRELQKRNIPHSIHPKIGSNGPELSIVGFIKAKKQDVVILMNGDLPQPETIPNGPLKGVLDDVGKVVSERSIITGVRSQLSSVAKNFDTLMERAFAETLNLRLRMPKIVMGEIYLLPIVEYDDSAMYDNEVLFKSKCIPVEKFIKTFLAISGRTDIDEKYKYDRSCLILADFRPAHPKVYFTLDDLKNDGIVSKELLVDFRKLAPDNFSSDLIDAYQRIHKV